MEVSHLVEVNTSVFRYVNEQFYTFEPPDYSLCLTVNRSTGDITLECAKRLRLL